MEEKIVKKLQGALKLSGFSVRRNLCKLIVDKFIESQFDLDNNATFERCLTKLSSSLEGQCVAGQSIEEDHITRATEICLQSGYDRHETIFNVINAFDFPKLNYDRDRKLYLPSKTKSVFLCDASTKSQLFLDRYYSILQRIKRSFLRSTEGLKLQSIDYLLTLSYIHLETTLILGSLLQVSEGKYFLEDPSGIVQLDLSHAKYHSGFFVENTFVLVNGLYEDKILRVASMMLPPGEEYADSRPSFGKFNYFGGTSKLPLKDSQRLKEHNRNHAGDEILFFSDVWLDHPQIFEKLESLFTGLQNSWPIAFVFMGNFISESHGGEKLEILKKLFRQFAELINRYPNLVNNSRFVFVPGITDPCTTHIVPRLPLPNFIAEEMKKILPKAIFATNPCRIQYCDKEIVLFRADVLVKLLQGTLFKPQKNRIPDCLARTVISQGHLSPMSLNALTVHWGFDYTLRLYPLPDLVVIGDRSESYKGSYKRCTIINPGSFCETGFTFSLYYPHTGEINECELN